MPQETLYKSPTTTPERKLSRRGAETEQRFLDAANEVFWAKGFAGATIAQIISAGELSVGSFYHLFADKNVLLERATQRLLTDFHNSFKMLDLSRSANVDVFTMLYRLTHTGRELIARHRGIYRATAELAQNDITGFGPLRTIAPTVVRAVTDVMPEYSDQIPAQFDEGEITSAVQLIAMSAMQTELGMGPLFPKDIHDFSIIISRAACGVLGYSGQTAEPAVTLVVGETR